MNAPINGDVSLPRCCGRWPVVRAVDAADHPAWYAINLGPTFMQNPTLRAIQREARSRDKAARAIQCEMRRMKFALYVELASLYFRKFYLQTRGLGARATSEVMQMFR